ncbi:uncharacterized protein EV154DRAFT_530035 [Mucor mucedo]|uniref:uncharacterized protein n=1 Tax=Mucor mucedo TaxID=29922 RepID=UPI002220D4B5|nr:uncharacterized protein EV154DRAFT_530035 [Mucor mucedo]KAI7870500.1 hypothetical protein EV154DRAFT_530035 [Mucor mucedo]
MAKSLRSQAKKRTRAIKRETIFKPVEDARLARLAEAQAEAAKKPSVGDFMDDKEEVATTTTTTTDADAMTEEEQTSKKISTSGPRSNRHARKLKERKMKGKKGANKF